MKIIEKNFHGNVLRNYKIVKMKNIEENFLKSVKTFAEKTMKTAVQNIRIERNANVVLKIAARNFRIEKVVNVNVEKQNAFSANYTLSCALIIGMTKNI